MRAFWADIPLERNTELCFICELPKLVGAEMSLIAKDIYNLYINGSFVGYGPARSAKGYARVEKIVLDDYLTEESNRVCIYVQSNYTKSQHLATEKPLFGAEVALNGKIIITAADFICVETADKVKKVEKTSAQRGFIEVYKMDADREKTVGTFPRRPLKEVDCPALLERGVSVSKNVVSKAKEYEKGGVTVDGTLAWDNPFTSLLESGENLYGYKRSDCEVVVSKELVSFVMNENETGEKSYAAYALDYVRCGKFKIEITAESDCDIWLVYDDILIDGKVKFNREQVMHGLKWSLKKGKYVLYSQEVYSARYITLIYDGKLDIKSVSVIRIENPDAENFSCEDIEDDDLREIVLAAKRSFEQNSYDVFTDCPSRERAGWLCDSYFMGKAEKFFTGKNIVEKNFLENYLLYKNEHYAHDGIVPMCYPSEPKGANDYLPNWILWYLLEIEDYNIRSGDAEFVARHKKRAYDVLDFFASFENEYGFLENLGGWVFIEWSKANDFIDGVNFPTNVLYAEAIATVGRTFGDELLVEKSKKLKEKIKRIAFNGEVFIDNAVRVGDKLELTDNVSETCQNFACYFNLITKEENPEYYRRFLKRFGAPKNPEKVCPSNMFMGYVMRLMVLSREGYTTELLSECKSTFTGMAKRTGTIWELFSENASCNHGFGSVVAELIVSAYRKDGRE